MVTHLFSLVLLELQACVTKTGSGFHSVTLTLFSSLTADPEVEVIVCPVALGLL